MLPFWGLKMETRKMEVLAHGYYNADAFVCERIRGVICGKVANKKAA